MRRGNIGLPPGIMTIGNNPAITFIFALGITGLQAQESVNATGGNAAGNGGSASYSVGQVAYQTHPGSNGAVAEGVQQPYEISVVSAIEQTIGINLAVSAYPNPTTDKLILLIDAFDLSNVSYQLYDISGKVMYNKGITSDQTAIEMSALASSTYFIKVTQDNKEVKTFKIIKQ